MLLVFGAPLASFPSLAGPEHGRTIPLADIGQVEIPQRSSAVLSFPTEAREALTVKRREFITFVGGVAAAWPLAARAQQAAKVVRIGYLAPARLPNLIEALRAGLRDFGYVEGQNLTIEYRFALGQTKSYNELAQELVSLDPAAIVLTGTPAALALKRQTTTIPIVLAPIADPIALGLARSLARPGGNVTGLTMFGPELAHKRMEIFREAVAGIRRVAVLVNAENPLHPFLWDDIQPIGPLLGLELRRLSVSDFNELPTMFSTMARDGFNALTVFSHELG